VRTEEKLPAGKGTLEAAEAEKEAWGQEGPTITPTLLHGGLAYTISIAH
jgi:hypothetical protein